MGHSTMRVILLYSLLWLLIFLAHDLFNNETKSLLGRAPKQCSGYKKSEKKHPLRVLSLSGKFELQCSDLAVWGTSWFMPMVLRKHLVLGIMGNLAVVGSVTE